MSFAVWSSGLTCQTCGLPIKVARIFPLPLTARFSTHYASQNAFNHPASMELFSTHSRVGKLVDSFDQSISVAAGDRRSNRK